MNTPNRGPSVAEAERAEQQSTTALAVSVVMPAFNEAEILESSVRAVVDGMRSRGRNFELIPDCGFGAVGLRVYSICLA